MHYVASSLLSLIQSVLSCIRVNLSSSVFQCNSQVFPDGISVDPTSGHFVDSYGRVRLFHGINAVYKEAPWLPRVDNFSAEESLDSTTIELLKEWGFNVVRLGVMWPGVEPEPRRIDGSYLHRAKHLTRELAERGIYTIADLHQDLGSSHFCGEGFPEAYVDALLQDPRSRLAQAPLFPEPLGTLPRNASGLPVREECLKRLFSDYYSTFQVGALWAELYREGSELYEGFLRYWAAVAKEFKDEPQLVAFELLNEPSDACLEARTAPGCLSGQAIPVRFNNDVEVHKLMPLYQAAARAIRGAGAPQVILYEPTVWPKIGAQVFPGPVLNDTKQGLAYHIYCAPGDGRSFAAGLLCDAAQSIFERTFYPFLQRNKRLAGFMTEFGAVGGSSRELEHLSHLLDAADEHLQSWTYWQLKKFKDFTTANAQEPLFRPDGQVETEKLRALSRTYAFATAGIPTKMRFDQSGAFELDFVATVQDAPTEIFLNEALHYPTGYSISVDPSNCLNVQKAQRNYLNLTLANSACLGQLLKVRLWPSTTQIV
ncbi:unnamed protein product [Symbiodinium natans]|uniref:Endoglycoceramidase n=1 Tax=Symbiodinium natans TaxID=878477 RepID=A0A812KPF6_9DINO|nr:unnamed protein product [Symbiodinium natans]